MSIIINKKYFGDTLNKENEGFVLQLFKYYSNKSKFKHIRFEKVNKQKINKFYFTINNITNEFNLTILYKNLTQNSFYDKSFINFLSNPKNNAQYSGFNIEVENFINLQRKKKDGYTKKQVIKVKNNRTEPVINSIEILDYNKLIKRFMRKLAKSIKSTLVLTEFFDKYATYEVKNCVRITNISISLVIKDFTDRICLDDLVQFMEAFKHINAEEYNTLFKKNSILIKDNEVNFCFERDVKSLLSSSSSSSKEIRVNKETKEKKRKKKKKGNF